MPNQIAVHECLLIATGGELHLGIVLQKTKLTENELMNQIAHMLSKRSSDTKVSRGPVPNEKRLSLAVKDILSTYH
jgi:hypothetical protein